MERWLAALLAVAFPAFAADPFRFTERCNPQATSRVNVGITDTFIDNLHALAHSDFPRYMDAVRRLWEPQAINPFLLGGNWFAQIDYDPRQDAGEIADGISADPVLRALGVTSAQVAGPRCQLGLPTAPSPVPISEFRNRVLDHYILSDRFESGAIAAGAAGPGWESTREGFTTIAPGICTGSQAVFRFYAPSVKSHLYTMDPVECGHLRKPGTGWIHEGIAFGAWKPVDGECPQGKRPVWGIFNNRADPNHRYLANPSRLSEDLLRGWVYEGVAFCVSP